MLLRIEFQPSNPINVLYITNLGFNAWFVMINKEKKFNCGCFGYCYVIFIRILHQVI